MSRVDRLRAALHARDIATVTELMASARVCVAVRDDQPVVGTFDGVSTVAVFLSYDSFEKFVGANASTDEPRLLAPDWFKMMLEHLPVDTVLFDPALESAIELPRADVLHLLAAV